MKTFQFPLDRALHIRRVQWEMEQAKLKGLTHEREQLDLRANVVMVESANMRRTLSTQLLVMATEISMVPDYQRGATQRLLKLDRQKLDLVKRIQEQQGRTVEAERKVKLLERLRSKRFAEWDSLMQKEQENFAADAHLARWSSSH